jgi:hypothetical protein
VSHSNQFLTDALTKLAEIRALQLEMADTAAWTALPQVCCGDRGRDYCCVIDARRVDRGRDYCCVIDARRGDRGRDYCLCDWCA